MLILIHLGPSEVSAGLSNGFSLNNDNPFVEKDQLHITKSPVEKIQTQLLTDINGVRSKIFLFDLCKQLSYISHSQLLSKPKHVQPFHEQ